MFAKGPDRHHLEQLAAQQWGHVTRRQLLHAGWTADTIKSHLRRGLLVGVHSGVYAIGHIPRHAMARAAAAVLACGDGAALSHSAALALWELGEWPAIMEVSALRQRRRPGIRTHRTKTLPARDTRRRHGIRVTSPARTIADVAPRLSDAQLTRLVNDARVARLVSLDDIIARCPRVAALLTERPTRSALEDLFVRFTRRHRLPMPEINTRLPNGREVDALYREQGLIVELDSWEFHQSRASFERDRAKDAAALADGYRTVRITRARLTRGGNREAATIRRILAQ